MVAAMALCRGNWLRQQKGSADTAFRNRRELPPARQRFYGNLGSLGAMGTGNAAARSVACDGGAVGIPDGSPRSGNDPANKCCKTCLQHRRQNLARSTCSLAWFG